MARRFMDSVGYYAAADLTKKWTNVRGLGGREIIDAPEGRGTGKCLANQSSVYPGGASVTLDEQDSWTVGGAFWFGGGGGLFMGLERSDGNSIGELHRNADGTLTVYHTPQASWPFPTALGTTDFALSEATWFYIEMQYVTGENGSVEVRVDGTTRLQVTGIDTRSYDGYGIMPSPNAVAVYAAGLSTTASVMLNCVRDVWINDAQETDWQGLPTTHTGFDGDRRIRVLLPETPSGAYSEWTGSDEDSTDNYALVDENPTNVADYVTSSTVGHRDSYNFQDVPDEAGSVGPLQLVLIAQKDYTDPRMIRGTTRIDATDYEADAEFGVSGSSHTLGTSWNGYRQIWEVQPVAGNAAWDKATVDSAEFGAKLTT